MTSPIQRYTQTNGMKLPVVASSGHCVDEAFMKVLVHIDKTEAFSEASKSFKDSKYQCIKHEAVQ